MSELQVGLINLKAGVQTQIAAGEINLPGSHVILQAQTGTTDDLDTINLGTEGDIVILRADTGDTITLKHGTGNIITADGQDLVISGQRINMFTFDGGDWVQMSGSGANTTFSAFRAFVSPALTTGTTGNGAGLNLPCNVENYDYGSDYDNTTYTFTAPVDGIYRYDISLDISDLGAANDLQLTMTVGLSIYILLQCNPSNMADNSNGRLVLSTFFEFYMNAGDTAIGGIVVSGKGTDDININTYTSISGRLVREI